MNKYHIGKDFSVSASVAGLVALLATYSGPVLIVVQAAQAGQLTQEELSTWLWALSIGAGVVGLWLSFQLRVPVIGAWSTPGAALLISGLGSYTFSEAVGVYFVVSIIVFALGVTGVFARFLRVLPTHLLASMVAGVMFLFCAKIFPAMQVSPTLVGPIVICYVFARRVMPRYAVAVSLVVGILTALSVPYEVQDDFALRLVMPEPTAPVFTIESLVALGLPLLMLALTQNATGVTILRTAGYPVPDNGIVRSCGIVSIPLAFFGSPGINPAAIVGAICASPECHEDPNRRYVAGLVCGVGYLVLGVFGTSVLVLFSLLPSAVISTLAALALLGTLGQSLASALSNEAERESSLITFLIVSSGVDFWGLGSALGGLAIGLVFSWFIKVNVSDLERVRKVLTATRQ